MEPMLGRVAHSQGRSRASALAAGHTMETIAPSSYVQTRHLTLRVVRDCNATGMGPVMHRLGPVFVMQGILDLTATSVCVHSVQTTSGELA